jgi:glutamyl-tRNA synthetase
MLGFLFVADDAMMVDDDALATVTRDVEQSASVLDRALAVLAAGTPWDAASLEGALREAIVDGLGIKPRLAFGPLRVAVSGRRVSPPLFESMEILGRASTLARLRALRARLD